MNTIHSPINNDWFYSNLVECENAFIKQENSKLLDGDCDVVELGKLYDIEPHVALHLSARVIVAHMVDQKNKGEAYRPDSAIYHLLNRRVKQMDRRHIDKKYEMKLRHIKYKREILLCFYEKSDALLSMNVASAHFVYGYHDYNAIEGTLPSRINLAKLNDLNIRIQYYQICKNAFNEKQRRIATLMAQLAADRTEYRRFVQMSRTLKQYYNYCLYQ